MKIAVRYGHSPRCKGASSKYGDEQNIMSKLAPHVCKLLRDAGHQVLEIKSNETTINGDLAYGVNKANAWGAELFVSLHMNASNGQGQGTEVWLYNGNNASLKSKATKIVANFSSIGLKNRGVKYSTGLYELKRTAMPAMIVETMFVDNAHDMQKVFGPTSWEKLARCVANGIDPKISLNEAPAKKKKYKVTVSGIEDPKRKDLAVKVLKDQSFNVNVEEYWV